MNIYPWPLKLNILISQLLVRSKAQERYGKGDSKGGWFKGKAINENQPMSVIYAKKAHINWNSRRVKLAKLKKRYKDKGGNDKELESQINALEGDVAHFRKIFDRRIAGAKEEGYKIDSRGDWANAPEVSSRTMRPVGGGNRTYGKVNTSNASDDVQKKALDALKLAMATNTETGETILDDNIAESMYLNEITGNVRIALTDEMAKNSKRNIVNNLAERTGIPVEKVNNAIHEWAMESNSTVRAMSMQVAASEEFDVGLSKWQESTRLRMKETLSIYKTPGYQSGIVNSDLDRGVERKLLRTMYDETQRELEELDIDEITLYRGFRDYENKVPTSGNIIIDDSAMSSWSVNPDTALGFASGLTSEHGRMVKAVIPRSRILSCASTGFGCLDEMEFVVLGSNEPDLVTIYAQ